MVASLSAGEAPEATEPPTVYVLGESPESRHQDPFVVPAERRTDRFSKENPGLGMRLEHPSRPLASSTGLADGFGPRVTLAASRIHPTIGSPVPPLARRIRPVSIGFDMLSLAEKSLGSIAYFGSNGNILPAMERSPIHTSDAPPALGPYSQAIQAQGRFLFLSGQIPLRPDGTLVEGDVREQTAQVIANLRAVLQAAGLTPMHLVKTTIFLSSMDHFQAVNEVYGTLFDGAPPARSTFAVAGLPKAVDVEIEGIAVY